MNKWTHKKQKKTERKKRKLEGVLEKRLMEALKRSDEKMESYSRKTDEKIESYSKKTDEGMNDFSRKADELMERFVLVTNTVGNQIQEMSAPLSGSHTHSFTSKTMEKETNSSGQRIC